MKATKDALESVLQERKKQIEKWGDQHHTAATWMLILGEEFGEASQAVLHDKFGGDHAGTWRKELVQVAAVATQVIEHIDNNSIIQDNTGTQGKG